MRYLKTFIIYAGLLALAAYVLVPIWGLAYLAFDGGVKGWPRTFRVWPESFTLDIFRQMWERPAQTLSFLGALQNSLVVAVGSALLAVVCGASLAYAFARWRFPGRRPGLFGLLVGALLPPIALTTPLYVLLSALQLRTSLLGLCLAYTALALPFAGWNLRAAFQALPQELEEAAYLDGATPWQAFWLVSLPLAAPAILVAALLAFLLGYSEFALGWLFVEKGDNVTLAMAVFGMLAPGQTLSMSRLAALALLMSAPVVGLFLGLQSSLRLGWFQGNLND